MPLVLKEQIAEQFTAARADTLRLFDLAEEQHLHQSPGFGFRPIIWHLAHIGVFEAYWLLQKMQGLAPLDDRYELIFDPINTPRENSKDLPTRREMESFLHDVRHRSMEFLDRVELDETNPMLRDAYVFNLVLEHEYQHQETLAYLLHLLDPALKARPVAPNVDERIAISTSPDPEMITVSEGPFEMGATGSAFAYDNERPAHVVVLPAFKIARLLTTNEEFARFVDEGGYRRREFWSDEGWQWKEKEEWANPLYWTRGNDGWSMRTLFDDGVWLSQHPVTGISWYEAEAYARFMKRRLPTEAEWEKAASFDPVSNRRRRFAWGDQPPSAELTNFHGHFQGTTPVGTFSSGASAYGCMDMTGNVWEWTSDSFDGYPGFEPFPYPEYSQIWFDGDHRILKGGSWATREPVLRTSFRNFFRRQFRIGFAGIRLAEDG